MGFAVTPTPERTTTDGTFMYRRDLRDADAYSRVADLFAKYLQVDPDDGSSRPH